MLSNSTLRKVLISVPILQVRKLACRILGLSSQPPSQEVAELGGSPRQSVSTFAVCGGRGVLFIVVYRSSIPGLHQLGASIFPACSHDNQIAISWAHDCPSRELLQCSYLTAQLQNGNFVTP